MFLEDPLENLWRTAPVPGAFGIDHGDRTAPADLETLRLGTVETARAVEVEFPDASLQVLPRAERLLARRTIRPRAKQQVPAVPADAAQVYDPRECLRLGFAVRRRGALGFHVGLLHRGGVEYSRGRQEERMAAVEAVLIGGGNRGRYTYGAWALRHPDRLRIVGLAEPVAERRAAVAAEHRIEPDRVVADWREILSGPRFAEVAIIATSDTLHVEPALEALSRGHHLLLEKPIAPDPVDCVRVVDAAEKAERVVQIGHVLRYTEFYGRLREIVSSGRLGEIVAIDMKEHVAHWHLAHSYVRGKFRNRRIAAPIVLAKTCHDLDLLAWLVDRPFRRVASFGSLSHFRSDAAPPGAPDRCTDGCPVQDDCLHDAVRFYCGPDESLARIWPWTDLGIDPSREARRRALETGPYGVCVYRCDNDVPDHQILAIEFDGGVTATFTLQGLATHERRTIRVSGTRGELRGVFQDGQIEITRHGSLERETLRIEAPLDGHSGGDHGLLSHFTDLLRRRAYAEVRASGRVSLESHLLGFAAEEARLRGTVIEMPEYRDRIAREVAVA